MNHASLLLPNGKVLDIGGADGSNYFNSVEALDDPARMSAASLDSLTAPGTTTPPPCI